MDFDYWVNGDHEFMMMVGGPIAEATRRLYGGDGGDVIVSTSRAGIIDAGDGDDIVGGHAPIVRLGAGDDRFLPGAQIGISAGHVIDGGDGYDVLDFNEYYRSDEAESTEFPVLEGFEKWVLHEHWMETYIITDANIARGLLEIEVSAWDLRTLDASAVASGSIRFTNLYNRAYAEYGQSVVLGGALDDAMHGGTNVDQFQGNGGDDRFDGGDGEDIAVFSGDAADYIVTEITYNTFTVRDTRGIDGTDSIVDVNVLRFADGDVPVVIRGMNIVGDDSDEAIAGGGGKDRFVFDALLDSTQGIARDRIGDFERKVDEIDLSGIDADATRKGDQAFHFLGNDRFDKTPGGLRFANGILGGDVDGDSNADFEIAVAGDLLASDLLL